MNKIVVFETFYNPIEASIVKSRLLDSGVQCFLSDEHTLTVNPLYNQALGGVRLHVFENDIPLIQSILNEEAGEIPAEETTASGEACPYCGSCNTGYVQATQNRFSIFTMLVSFLLAIYPFRAKKAYHCFDCTQEF